MLKRLGIVIAALAVVLGAAPPAEALGGAGIHQGSGIASPGLELPSTLSWTGSITGSAAGAGGVYILGTWSCSFSVTETVGTAGALTGGCGGFADGCTMAWTRVGLQAAAVGPCSSGIGTPTYMALTVTLRPTITPPIDRYDVTGVMAPAGDNIA